LIEQKRNNKRIRGNGYGKGTFVETSLYLSPAYLSLGDKGTSPKVSSSSHKILMLLLGKRQYKYLKDKKNSNKRLKRADDNKLTLTYKELENRGINRNKIPRGFDELLAKGFISIVDQGGAYEKHKTVYALEDDFLLWTIKDKQVFYQRNEDVHRGYQDPSRRGKPESTRVKKGHPHARQRVKLVKRTRMSTRDNYI
jgi:hypothetical protein